MDSAIDQLNTGANNPTPLQRIADRDQTAVEDCLNTYGNWIWAAAKKYAASTEEAEIIAREIFTEILKCAERFNPDKCSENNFIALIAHRNLIKRQQKNQSSAASAK